MGELDYFGGRYQLHTIASGSFGDILFTSDDASVAKAKAVELVTLYCGGVAIIDTVTGLVDLGSEIIPVAQVFTGACADCGSTGHDTGSNTCSGPDIDRVY